MRGKQSPPFWRHQMCFTNFPGLWQALTERSIASARLLLVLSCRAPSSPVAVQPRIKSSQALPSASMGQCDIKNLVLIFIHLDLSLQRHLLLCFDSNLQAFYLACDVFWTLVEEDQGDIWMETVIWWRQRGKWGNHTSDRFIYKSLSSLPTAIGVQRGQLKWGSVKKAAIQKSNKILKHSGAIIK